MRVLVKVGGRVLDDAECRAAFAASVAAAVAAGHDVVVVHGGGAQLTRLAERLGLGAEERVDGLRVTGPEQLRAALQALAGEVNADLVLALGAAGVRAIGVTGADGGLMRATQRDPRLGLVGDVAAVDGSVVDDLVGAGFSPVVATLAPSPLGFLNVNADGAVAPLAAAAGADAVLFLSDVPHVRGEGDAALDSIDASEAARLRAAGVIAGGMIPKVEAGLAAAAAVAPRGGFARMGSGLAPDPVGALLAGGGTTFVAATSEVTA